MSSNIYSNLIGGFPFDRQSDINLAATGERPRDLYIQLIEADECSVRPGK